MATTTRSSHPQKIRTQRGRAAAEAEFKDAGALTGGIK
jgi:hypothetical protein